MYRKDTRCGVEAIDTLRTIHAMTDWIERTKQKMVDMGLTQTDLMTAFGVRTRGAVGHYLSRRRTPTPDQIIALAKKLRISAGELLDGEVPAPSQSQVMELDLDMLKSAIAAAKEAFKSFNREMDAYDSAPLIAFAYRERAALPRMMSKAEYRAFDAMVTAKLRGDLGDVGTTRRIATSGTRSTAKGTAARKASGNRK